MDSVLTEFISRTSAEPALARDILESNKWSLNDALRDFNYMNEIVKPKLIETNLDADLFEKLELDSKPSPRPEVNLDFKIDLRTDKTNGIPTECKSDLKSETKTEANCDPNKCDSRSSLADSKPDTLVKSNSHPLLNGTISSSVIDNEPNVSIKLNNKSIDKLSDSLLADQPSVIQKKLFRGISRATDNIHLVSKVRGEFAQDFQSIKDNDTFTENLTLDLPNHTFTMPDLSIHPDDFRQFLEKDLIEKSTLISLKSAKRLNWWADQNIAQELWPLATTGDGNCLLHAASLGTWGFHDRLLTLRKALHYYLINSCSNVDSFYKRWRFQCTLENKKAGLILGEEEWKNDWQNLLKMASTEPRVIGNSYVKTTKTIELNGGKKEICEEEFANHVYESLEEIHILALAHVLKRPIIVIADTVLKDINNQPFAPIPFGGIYLPLLCDPKDCNKAPLCLTYDAAHFSSLVAMDHESYADRTPLPPAVIPLVDWEGKLLPVQFIVEPPTDLKYEEDDSVIDKLIIGEREKINLLDRYLDLVYINKETKEVISSEKFKKQQNQEKQIKCEQESKNEIAPADRSTESSSPSSNRLSVNSSKLLNSKNLSSSANLVSSTANNSAGLSAGRKKSFNFGSLSSLTQKFSSLRRSVSKKFRRNLNTVNANINQLARRSSFRLSRRASKLNKSESQTKSTNNLETSAVSNVSLNSPISKSPAISVEKSPSKSSTKSPIKSTKSPSKSVKSVSSGNQEPVEQAAKPEEESVIPNQLVLAAELHLDKLPSYRDEFIRNYLATARFRFLNECDSRSTTEKSVQKVNSSEYSSHKGSTVSCASSASLNSSSNFKEEDYATQCVSNSSCSNFGKSSTNYLCEECFISQKKELIEIESAIKTES